MGSKRICDYDSYFLDQAGGNLDIAYYKAFPYQRGYGRFSQFFKRYGIPAGKYLLQHAIEFGKNLYNDVREGKDVKESLKTNVRKQASSAINDIGARVMPSQKGSGRRRKVYKRKKIIKRKKAKKSVKKSTKRKSVVKFRKFSPDIFQ